MGRYKIKKRFVRFSETDVDPASPLLPPTDERLVQLIADVQTGKAPSWKTTVLLAGLAVHHPATLTGARVALRSNPDYRDTLAATKQLMNEQRPPWLVYRDEASRLVMFDDYALYVAAEELGLTSVDVVILGEAEQTTKP